MCTAIVAKLVSGFESFADVESFLKKNVDELLTVASEPAKAAMTCMVGTPKIMKFLVSCKDKEPEEVTPAHQPQNQVEESFEAKYARKLKENQEKMQRIVTAPHSNAYMTLNLEGSRALTMKETKIVEDFDQNVRV